MNDDLFNYLIATNTLDDFLGYKENDNTSDELVDDVDEKGSKDEKE